MSSNKNERTIEAFLLYCSPSTFPIYLFFAFVCFSCRWRTWRPSILTMETVFRPSWINTMHRQKRFLFSLTIMEKDKYPVAVLQSLLKFVLCKNDLSCCVLNMWSVYLRAPVCTSTTVQELPPSLLPPKCEAAPPLPLTSEELRIINFLMERDLTEPANNHVCLC